MAKVIKGTSRSARPSGKKGIAKKGIAKKAMLAAPAKSPSRKAKATASGRTRKPAAPLRRPMTASKAKATARARVRVMVVPPSEPLFRAAELDGAAIEASSLRKAARKGEGRPVRGLPIPQATYFF